MDKTLNDGQEEEKNEKKKGKNEDQRLVFIKCFGRRVQKR